MTGDGHAELTSSQPVYWSRVGLERMARQIMARHRTARGHAAATTLGRRGRQDGVDEFSTRTSGEVAWDRDMGKERYIEPRLVSLVRPDSFDADQYRTLGHAVELAGRAAAHRVLAITSPVAGDGKTLTAINLAVTLARSARSRVLLVDTDLRRPAVTRYLGWSTSDRPGLVDAILDRQYGIDETASRVDPVNLWVIGASATRLDHSELLRSARLGELIEDARRRYDYVLLDTAPLMPVPDGWILDQWVDAFIIVVAAGRTPRKLVEEAVTRLGTSKILGFVFNGERYTALRYGRYYRGYYT